MNCRTHSVNADNRLSNLMISIWFSPYTQSNCLSFPLVSPIHRPAYGTLYATSLWIYKVNRLSIDLGSIKSKLTSTAKGGHAHNYSDNVIRLCVLSAVEMASWAEAMDVENMKMNRIERQEATRTFIFGQLATQSSYWHRTRRIMQRKLISIALFSASVVCWKICGQSNAKTPSI